MSEFLGSRISLISRSDIRYVGTLHEINSDDSTVSLENVKSFGTEGRKGNPTEEVAASDQVYDYIIFRGTDVKDLRIEEPPAPAKENKPLMMPDDPAILGARPRQGNGGKLPGPPGPQGLPGAQPGPPGPFGYYPPPMGGWGQGSGPRSNGFGPMSYPHPPQWFPPGQDFGPMSPGPWGNYAFPPGSGAGGPPGGMPLGPLGGPPGALGVPGLISRQAPNHPQSSPGQGSNQNPIGTAIIRKNAVPAQETVPLQSQASAQPVPAASTTAPTPPVDSKPTIEEVKATVVSLGAGQPEAESPAKAGVEVAKPSKPSQILPAIPIPAALTSRAARQPQLTAKADVSDVPTSSALKDATEVAKAAVEVAMSKLHDAANTQQYPSAQAPGVLHDLSKKVGDIRLHNNNSRVLQAGHPRGGSRGPRGPRPSKVEVPDSDFDFATSNAKFNKQDLAREAIAGSQLSEATNGNVTGPESSTVDANSENPAPAYNKSKSFFDNISSEAKDRLESNGQKPGGREWRGEEQRKNMETFGQGSVDGVYRNYRGRGRGRGVRGGRGGHGRGGGYRNRAGDVGLGPPPTQ